MVREDGVLEVIRQKVTMEAKGFNAEVDRLAEEFNATIIE